MESRVEGLRSRAWGLGLAFRGWGGDQGSQECPTIPIYSLWL